MYLDSTAKLCLRQESLKWNQDSTSGALKGTPEIIFDLLIAQMSLTPHWRCPSEASIL